MDAKSNEPQSGPGPPDALRLLVIEDHADIAAMIGDYLTAHDHRVDFARDGEAGLRLALGQAFDAIVLDRALPRLDGVEVCRQLRTRYHSAVPVLMLTAMDATLDRIHGLNAGADDYLVKPFSLPELEARLQALHRRASGKVASPMLRVADLEYNTLTMQARRAGQPLLLSRTTRRLLEHLMRSTDRIVPRAELEFLLWRDEAPDHDVLRAHMHKLREAVDRGFEPKLLQTQRGVGYRLAAPE